MRTVSPFFTTSILLLLFFSITGFNHKISPVRDKETEQLYYPELVNTFYRQQAGKLVWMIPGDSGIALRQQMLDIIDSAFYWGMLDTKYHRAELQSLLTQSTSDSLAARQADRLYTDAAIAVSKDIYQGFKKKSLLGYDQLSAVCADKDNDHILAGLGMVHSAGEFQQFLNSLEPKQQAYTVLKDELKRQLKKSSKDTVVLLQTSLNYYRWIQHFDFDRMIIINLPAARLRYYEGDSLWLDMKTVVGKPATPTPRFATVCDQAILYPYWYVPPSIIFNEYLPKIKNDPSWLDAHNMQVINAAGKVLDHHQLNWAAFTNGRFPYSIRQSTGCDNALGVIKFNIITPYGVYLHDTNNKTAFLSALRFYSHGCIRLEDPFELGNRLLEGRLDTGFLQSCFKEQKPVFVRLGSPVPVFAVYMPAAVERDGKVHYYKDVYKLLD